MRIGTAPAQAHTGLCREGASEAVADTWKRQVDEAVTVRTRARMGEDEALVSFKVWCGRDAGEGGGV